MRIKVPKDSLVERNLKEAWNILTHPIIKKRKNMSHESDCTMLGHVSVEFVQKSFIVEIHARRLLKSSHLGFAAQQEASATLALQDVGSSQQLKASTHPEGVATVWVLLDSSLKTWHLGGIWWICSSGGQQKLQGPSWRWKTWNMIVGLQTNYQTSESPLCIWWEHV